MIKLLAPGGAHFGDSSALGTRYLDSEPPPAPPIIGYDLSPYVRALRALKDASPEHRKELHAMLEYLDGDVRRTLSPVQLQRLSEIEKA